MASKPRPLEPLWKTCFIRQIAHNSPKMDVQRPVLGIFREDVALLCVVMVCQFCDVVAFSNQRTVSVYQHCSCTR